MGLLGTAGTNVMQGDMSVRESIAFLVKALRSVRNIYVGKVNGKLPGGKVLQNLKATIPLGQSLLGSANGALRKVESP